MKDARKKTLSPHPPTCRTVLLFFFSHFKETSQEACPEPLMCRKPSHYPQGLCIAGQPLEGHTVQPLPQTLSLLSLFWVMSLPFATHGMRHLNCNTQQLAFDRFSEFVVERAFPVPVPSRKLLSMVQLSHVAHYKKIKHIDT